MAMTEQVNTQVFRSGIYTLVEKVKCETFKKIGTANTKEVLKIDWVQSISFNEFAK